MIEEYNSKKITVEQSIDLIKPGMCVYIEQGPAEPITIVEGLIENAKKISDVRLIASPVPNINNAPFADQKFKENWKIYSFFCSPKLRNGIADGIVEYIPAHSSEISKILHTTLQPNIALLQVSPPDASGFCNIGVHINTVREAIDASNIVIAQVNSKLPITSGTTGIHIREIDYFVEAERDLFEFPQIEPGETDKAISEHVVPLISDGSTLQIGIGGVPDAILDGLNDKNDLGIHSGVISNKVMNLMKLGVITGEKKRINPRKVVGTSMLGTNELYEFSNGNPNIEIHPASYINDIYLAKEMDNFVSINSAIDIDLTGQINSETIKGQMFAGVGGQQDFMRMAKLSKGGKSIIAMSATARGNSKILPFLPEGTPASTPRVDIDYVVTEFGVADLKYQSLRERGRRLAAIAHPDFQSDLRKLADRL